MIAINLEQVLAEISGLSPRELDAKTGKVGYEVTLSKAALEKGVNEVALGAIARAAIEAEDHGSTIEQQVRIFRQPLKEIVTVSVTGRPNSEELGWWRVDFHDSAIDSFAEAMFLRTRNVVLHQDPTDQSYTADEEAGISALQSVPTDISEQRVDQIIRGAYEVIASKGFAKASMREIARAANMPIPTMYHYIGSKDDLLSMIFEHFAGRLADEFKETLSHSTDISETLKNSIVKYLDYCKENRKFINLIYRETRSIKRESRNHLFKLDKSFTKVWSEILKLGVERGEFDVEDANLTAEFIYFLCTIWAIRHWSLRAYSQEQVSTALVTFILRGVRAAQ